MIHLKNPSKKEKLSFVYILINITCTCILMFVTGWAFITSSRVEAFDLRQEMLSTKVIQQQEFNKSVQGDIKCINDEVKIMKDSMEHKLDRIMELLLEK